MPSRHAIAATVAFFPPQSGAGIGPCPRRAGVTNRRFCMRKLIPLSAVAAAALLLGGASAYAQQKDTPAKSRGAGAECSRMTDAKARDECVHNAQSKDKSSQEQSSKSKSHKGSSTTHEGKGKRN